MPPLGGGRRLNIAITFGTENLEWCGHPLVKKFNMFSRFDKMPACDRQTDRQTEGQTDILREHSPHLCRASRGKNYMVLI